MKNRTLMILGILAALGWGVGFYFMLTRTLDPRSSTGGGHIEEEPIHDHATDEGPPVIRLAELPPLGFDSATLMRIEPHFHVLNAALVTLVEMHERFKIAQSREQRSYASVQSVTFHQTADKHEQMIEALLTPEVRARFHQYMLDKEAKVGLHPDSAWHAHRSLASRNPLPLFQHPEAQRQDSLPIRR